MPRFSSARQRNRAAVNVPRPPSVTTTQRRWAVITRALLNTHFWSCQITNSAVTNQSLFPSHALSSTIFTSSTLRCTETLPSCGHSPETTDIDCAFSCGRCSAVARCTRTCFPSIDASLPCDCCCCCCRCISCCCCCCCCCCSCRCWEKSSSARSDIIWPLYFAFVWNTTNNSYWQLSNMRRNEEIWEVKAKVEPIATVMRRLECFGHIKRRDETENIRAVVEMKWRGSDLDRDRSWGGKILSGGTWKRGISGRNGPLMEIPSLTVSGPFLPDVPIRKVSARPATPHRETATKGEKSGTK